MWEQGPGLSCVGQLGRHFPPPAFPRMLQRSWCQEPGAIWKRLLTAARDLPETTPSISAGLRLLAAGSCSALHALSGDCAPPAIRQTPQGTLDALQPQ